MIRLLPDDLINKIAAGEVVERPASVVKELVENSIDAGCAEVFVELADGGKAQIRVVDNGHGMGRDDALMSIERHATSKISSLADLEGIGSLGFRGEALPSIASVSRFTLTTSDGSGPAGTRIEMEGGRMKKVADAASPRGTAIEVRDLFFNVPARRKFLKSSGTELAHITHTLDQVALCYPSLYVRLTHNGRKVSEYPPVKSLRERVLQVYGAEVAEGLIPVKGEETGLAVRGLVSRPGVSRGDKKYQELFVNGRWVRNNSLGHALYEAFHSLLMRDRHPMALLFVEIDPREVDVNVHPAKSEVRFHEARRVHDVVRRTVQEALLGEGKSLNPSPWRDSGAESGRYRELVRHAPEVVREKAGHYASTAVEAVPAPMQRQETSTVRAAEGMFPVAAGDQPCFQLHQSYVIVETPEGFDIVDQHAAHERILYDRYRRSLRDNAVEVQGLLFPVPVSLPAGELSMLAEHLEQLRAMGLDMDLFGEGTLLVRGLPSFLASLDGEGMRALLSEIAGELAALEKSSRMEGMEEDLALLLICHSSVRARQRLDVREMQALLKKLAATEMPATCPHGRPIKVSFSIREMERMFKRV